MKKWALVTGASSGIGAATARELAKASYNVILVARRKDRIESLAREIEKVSPVQTMSMAGDVRERKFVDQLPDALKGKTVSVLVNNAGLAKGVDKMPTAEVSDWDEMIDTNIKGLLYMTRALLPVMMAQGEGHIVNVGSVAGRWVYPGGGVYCATKFAVRALTEGLRMDLLGTPIRVTNIEPGMVETEFSEVRLQSRERAKAIYKDMQPLSPEDVAEAIVWSLKRPAHVNVQEMVLFPTAQAAIQLVHRNPS
jgi:NADP-dependent 3-hydroxy acid dehydrogenase YdfG